MGLFYQIQGSMTVKDNKKTRKLLAALDDVLGQIDYEVVDNTEAKTFTVEINGGQFCTYGCADELDKALMAFDNHVVEVGHFDTCSENDEHSDLYVGPKADVEKRIREVLMSSAVSALELLTNAERREVYTALSKLPVVGEAEE